MNSAENKTKVYRVCRNHMLNLLGILITVSFCIPSNIYASGSPTGQYNVRNVSANSLQHTPSINPEIPLSIKFAGTVIDLDRLDMYERLDRELTSLVYGHSNTLLTLKRANRYAPVIMPILKAQGVPADIFYLAAVESYFNPRAYSPAKAAGIWQFMANTGKVYGLEINDEVDERYCPEKATVAACKYLKKAYSRYGDWPTVMASYNGGMTRISKELERQLQDTSSDLYLNEETSRYVFRIFAMKMILENPGAYGFVVTDKQLYQPIDYDIIKVSTPVENWSEWAKKHGISYAQLRDANPWIRKNTLTNKSGKTYKVKIPKKKELYRSKRQYSTFNKNWTK